MKKRLLSLLLMLCMVASLVPAQAFAADTAAGQNEIGAVYPSTFVEYKGYYYSLWETNGAIVRHKADGTENKMLFSYGGINDLNTLQRNDYLSDETMRDSFTNMLIYQDKIYVSVAKDKYVRDKDVPHYAAIYTMNLDGTGWEQLVKTESSTNSIYGSGPSTDTWCIWNDRLYYEANLTAYSVNLTGGDKRQADWKEYSDKNSAEGADGLVSFYGDEAYLGIKWRSYSVKGDKPETTFRLYKVNLQTNEVIQYKTINFKASLMFVEDGWAYITKGEEWWRIKTDGSEESEYLGNQIKKLTAYKGNLYFIDTTTNAAYMSKGLGKVERTLALTNPEAAKDIIIAGDYMIIDNEWGKVVTDLTGSKETFSLAYRDTQNYMESSLVRKNDKFVFRPTFKGKAQKEVQEEIVTQPISVSDTYFVGGRIKDGWYNMHCLYKYINIAANGDAELRYDTPTTAYYFEMKEDKQYTIKTREGKYLAISGDVKNGAKVTTSDTPYLWYMNHPEQGFLFDAFEMFPADNRKYIANASGEKFVDGTNLIVWEKTLTNYIDDDNNWEHCEMQLIPLKEDGTEVNRYTIKMSNWAYPTLSYRQEHPNMELGGDYTKPITRLQMAEVIMQLTSEFGFSGLKYLPGAIEETKVPVFTDTASQSTWYLAYWGITSGVGNNQFDPQGKVTREQMASFLVRTMDYYDSKVFINEHPSRGKGNLTQFNDANKISSWAKNDVATMVGTGYMSGSDGNINPSSYCTIEQALILCDRIKDSYNRAGGIGGEVHQPGISKGWYDDGNFTIQTKLGGYLTINGEGKSVVNKTKSQVFTRKFVSEEMYTFQTADGKYLGISGLPEDGKQITTQSQPYLWRLGGPGDAILLKPLNKKTPYYLNVSGFSKEDGAPIIIYTSKSGTPAPGKMTDLAPQENEKFIFTRVQ